MARTAQLTYDFPLIPESAGESTHFTLDPQRRIARLWTHEAFAWIVDRIKVTLLATNKVVMFHRTSDQSCRQYAVNLNEADFAELKSVLEAPRQEPPVARFEYELLHHDQSPCGDIYLRGWGDFADLYGAVLEVFHEQRLARVHAPNVTPNEGIRLVLEMGKRGNSERQRFECVETAKGSKTYDFTLEPEAFDRLSLILSNASEETFDCVWTSE